MKRHYRLKDPANFRSLFRGGRRVEGRFFRVIYISKPGAYPRFAFMAPLTVDKRSTVRNKLRRRTREWVRRHINELRRPFDIAIIFKKEAAAATRENFYEELARTFKKINS